MPTLVIRDVPKPLYKILQDRARAHRLSLSQEAVVALVQVLGMETGPALDWKNLPPPVKLKGWVDGSPEAVVAATHEGQE